MSPFISACKLFRSLEHEQRGRRPMSASSTPRAFTSVTVRGFPYNVWGDGYGKIKFKLPNGGTHTLPILKGDTRSAFEARAEDWIRNNTTPTPSRAASPMNEEPRSARSAGKHKASPDSVAKRTPPPAPKRGATSMRPPLISAAAVAAAARSSTKSSGPRQLSAARLISQPRSRMVGNKPRLNLLNVFIHATYREYVLRIRWAY